METIRGILFDNDGTLVDTEQIILESFRYATRKVLGKTIPDDELMKKVGQPLALQMWDFTTEQSAHDELLSVYRSYNHSIHDQRVRAFDGIVEALRTLKEHGYALGVVTSKLHDLAWKGLSITGCAPYLDCCLGPQEYQGCKPEPEPILAGAAALGLSASECVYVGDSPFDIAAGNAAGCKTVACLWGVFDEAALAAENPTWICASVHELLELFV